VSTRGSCSPRVLILLLMGLGSCGCASKDDGADETAGGSGGAGGSSAGMTGTGGMAAAGGSAGGCPETAPADATACPTVGATCAYADLGCACAPTGWICQTPCPTDLPANDTACRGIELIGCRYAAGKIIQGSGTSDTTCTCQAGKFACMAVENCPEAPPAAGAACNRPEAQICAYVGGALVTTLTTPDTTCTCKSNSFDCYTASDCPSEQPAANAACTQPGAVCSYDTQSCLCAPSFNAWLCAALP
jgi:hypothetical protein